MSVVLLNSPPILDKIPNIATAYSLRKIRSGATKSIRVRRSSDNAESDIGFTGSNLDTSSLASFVGSENLLLYSEEIQNAGYTAGDMSYGINSALAPDGTTTADTLIPSVNNVIHYIIKTGIITSANDYTVSAYFKYAGACQYILMQYAKDDYTKLAEGIFNINTGTVENTGRFIDMTATTSIESIGNGWYRCILEIDSVPTASNNITFVPLETNDPTSTFAGNGTDGILIWGVQWNTGRVKPYNKTVTGFGGNGFVTTWYDQSGNERNATQTTADKQPRIVNAGVIDLLNVKPTIKCDGVDDSLVANSVGIAVGTNNFTILAVCRFASQDGHMISLLNNGGTTTRCYITRNGSNTFSTTWGGNSAVPDNFSITDATNNIIGVQRTGTSVNNLANGNVGASATATFPSAFGLFSLGKFAFNESTYSNPWFSEIIVVIDTISTDDRQKIEKNQGKYYGITVA